ncbi:hypothetical protein [Bartonella schoenbuchensis]|uniref:Right handed beta helix domain-containing protein n=1 Tax=Bartonella schoenbuchensis m07a TaxID=1094496 RepID=N6VJ11_9HYPH|nr:hypothetical protein [Bartonella schoenbuchensis]ENN91022.1 hypothetical protein m07a_10270 [Bartonella schoenbuchensis m07a]
MTITGQNKGTGTGVYVAGTEGMMMTLDDVRISNVAMGVSVEKAKSLMMTGGSVTDFADYGVDVGENVKSAELKGVEIEGKNSGTGTGVYAKGGDVTLEKVEIKGVETGVYAEKGIFKMDGGSVTEFTEKG